MNATEESQQEEIEMDLISKLYDFVENGGRLEAGKEPVYGEPFYPEYMCQLVKSTYEIGDRVQVESENGMCSGVIIALGGYDMTLLISGHKVWKNQQNVKKIPWHHIRSVELSKKRKSDFDINSVDTEAHYQPHTKLYEDGFWEEKTENRRKRREEDKEQFQAACKDVPFEDSHVFCIDSGCRLYFPFKNNGVSAEVYIVQDNGKHAEKIPCKVGTPYPNKNSYHAYNHKDSDGDCQLYTYLPDAEKEYEHVSIVCVWTVKLPVTGKSTNIKFVHIYWAGKIEPTRDEHNMHLTNMDISTICGYGDAVFEKDNNWLLENIMAADSVFVLYPEDDSIRPIKASDNDDIYGFIAQQALAHFSIRDLLQTMVSDSNQFPVEVTVEKEVIMPGYFSSSWWRGKQRYEFKLLSQNNK